jgi:hypothetical protein
MKEITPRQVEAAKLLEGAIRGDRADKLKLQEGIATRQSSQRFGTALQPV